MCAWSRWSAGALSTPPICEQRETTMSPFMVSRSGAELTMAAVAVIAAISDGVWMVTRSSPVLTAFLSEDQAGETQTTAKTGTFGGFLRIPHNGSLLTSRSFSAPCLPKHTVVIASRAARFDGHADPSQGVSRDTRLW